MSSDPIAYTYEADHHCPACATERFGKCDHGWIAMWDDYSSPALAMYHDRKQAGVFCTSREDDEGNEIGAVFPWNEWHVHGETEPPYVLICGTCGGEITRCEEDE